MLVGTCAGCSGSPTSSPALIPIDGTRAQLDALTGEIIMPIDPYLFDATNADVALFKHVLDLAIGDCMAGRGLTYPVAGVTDDPASSPGDRTFGIWNVDAARLYGSGVATSRTEEAYEQAVSEGGADWQQAVSECFTSLAVPVSNEQGDDVQFPDDLAFLPTNADYGVGLGARLADEAAVAARADDRWDATARSWDACLREAGIEPPDSADDAIENTAVPGSEEDIRIATVSATCDAEAGRTQQLADIEAGYQARLIDDNEAALAPLKTDIAERIDAAEEYVAEHG